MAETTEYLLLEAHPAMKMPITPSDETAVIMKTPTLKSSTSMPLLNGRKEKVPTEATITRMGAR